VDWSIDRLNDQYQDGAGFSRLKEMTNSSDPQDIVRSQGLVYEFIQSEMNKQATIPNPSQYRYPISAYEQVNVSKVNRESKFEEVLEDYSQNAEGMTHIYGSKDQHKDQLDQSFEKAKGTQDTHSYFTENEIHYHRKATGNRFDIEAQKNLHKRAWKATSAQEETSKDYQVEVPFFWRRGETE
jgi:conjugal transfer mating pair stabilization protein TraG